MADVVSAIPYGTASQGQGLFATGTTAANWAYSAWDATTVSGTAGALAGTSPAAPVIGTGASPIRGTLTFGTGSAPSPGAMAVVTFGATLGATPVVMLTAGNTATAALTLAATAVSTTGFTVSCNTTPAASQGATAYSVGWVASL